MKLKICFHGILGGRKGKDGKGGMWNPKELYDHFNERVIIPNQDSFDIEISIHSWNENEKNEIIELYQPKNSIFEKQINFKQGEKNRRFSKLTSMFKSLDLIRESSDKDLIFSTRFDSWYRKPLVFDEFKEFIEGGKGCFVGDPPVWKKHKVDKRLQDFFFFSKGKQIFKYITHSQLENFLSLMKEDGNEKCYLPNGGRLDNHTIIRSIFDGADIERLETFRGNKHIDNWRKAKQQGYK